VCSQTCHSIIVAECLHGLWGMSGHGGGGHSSSAMGSTRGAGSVQSWIAAQGSGSGAHVRPLGSGTDALQGSTAIAGILRGILRALDVCSVWLCVCVHPCCAVQSSGSVRAERVYGSRHVSGPCLRLWVSSAVRFSVFVSSPLHHCC